MRSPSPSPLVCAMGVQAWTWQRAQDWLRVRRWRCRGRILAGGQDQQAQLSFPGGPAIEESLEQQKERLSLTPTVRLPGDTGTPGG